MTNSTTIPAPFEDSLAVKPAWLDANGHMNVAFYLQAFDDGGEVFFRDCGIGWDYTHAGVGSVFMSNCDLDFHRELFEGDTHIAFADRRSAPMPAAAQARLAAVLDVHAGLERPAALGRKIEIRN